MYKLNIIYLKCILHNKTFTIFILVIPVLGIDFFCNNRPSLHVTED